MYPYKEKKVDLTEINAECATVHSEYQKLKAAQDPRTEEVYTMYKYLCARRAQMMK